MGVASTNRRPAAYAGKGFTLIELMIVLVIVGILATIAYPSYVKSITRSKRHTATACLSSYATFMERFYTTNLRYDIDTATNDVTLPSLDCASSGETGQDYDYSLDATALSANTYKLKAVPKGVQATRDADCGTLTLDQAGTRNVTGSAGAASCW